MLRWYCPKLIQNTNLKLNILFFIGCSISWKGLVIDGNWLRQSTNGYTIPNNSVEKLEFILHLKYTIIINKNKLMYLGCLDVCFWNNNFFFNSIKILLISTPRPIYIINYLLSETLKNKLINFVFNFEI